MSPRAKKAPAPKPKRSEDRLRVIEIDVETGDIEIELTRRGRSYSTTIAGNDSVTMIEAAALCGVTRSTVYNWAKPSPRSYGYSSRPTKPLTVDDGRVELPELRRYLRDLGKWWLRDHPEAAAIEASGTGGGK